MRGRRRLVALAAVVATLLFAGRFGAQFLTDRLWEGNISEAAALVGTRFALLATALEIVGVVTAVTWFLFNFGFAARAIVHEFGDFPRPLGHLTERTVFWLVGGVAVVLGLGVGGGTRGWLSALLLAREGVVYGVEDTLLGSDLGAFVSDVPVLQLLEGRALSLLALALAGVVALSLAGGTLRFVDRRLTLAPRMRWHFALLLAGLASTLAAGFALERFDLAAERSATIGPAEFLLRATVAQLELAFAVVAALLTLLWGFRVRFVVALGGWVGLGLAVLAGTVLVESRSGDGPLGAPELSTLRRVDSVAFGISPAEPVRDPAPAPSLWDADALARVVEPDTGATVALLSGSVLANARETRAWLALRPVAGGEVSVLAVADDRTGPTGGPVSIRPGDSAFAPGLVPLVRLPASSARPGAPAFVLGTDGAGLALNGTVRRLAIGWALQFGRAFRAGEGQRVAWRLDPTERLATVAAFAQWGRPRGRVVDGVVYWVVDGFLTADRFPSSRSVPWRGAPARLVRAGFVGVVTAATGETRIFLRPDADSLAFAWSRIAAPLVEPSSEIPDAIRPAVGMPTEQFAVQAQVLQGPAWIGRRMARFGRQLYPVDDLAAQGTEDDPLTIPFLRDGGSDVEGVIVAPTRSGSLQTAVAVADSSWAIAGPRELQQRWDRFPFFQQLRDSVRAAGSEYDQGLIRFVARGDTLIAYQPNYALGPDGATALILVNAAMGGRLGSGRTFDDAWRNLRGEIGPVPVGIDMGARLEQAREWMSRADEALRRGDLEEFGRAFGFLREILRVRGGGRDEAKP